MIDGQTIKKIREGMGHTQVTFAEALNTTASTVSRWECNVIKPTGPTQLFLLRLQKELEREGA